MSFAPVQSSSGLSQNKISSYVPRGRRGHHRTSSLPNFTQLNRKLSKIEEEEKEEDGKEMNRIGNEYFKNGRYDDALVKYKEALIFFTTKYGLEHKTVATTMGNMGNVYWRIRDFPSAIKYLEKSLQILRYISCERNREEDKIEIASAYHSLGLVYLLQNSFDKALMSLHSALKIRGEIYDGIDSVDVARTMDAIGSVYSKMGRHNDAIKYFHEALRIKECLFSLDHFSVLLTMKNLASSYNENLNYEVALQFYEKILSIQTSESSYFPNEEIEQTLQSIASIISKRGKIDKTNKAYMKVLKKHEIITFA